jgi:hypothetical protein
MRTARAFAAVALLATAACDGDDPAGPDLTFEGTYVLSSINGKRVPASQTVEGVYITVYSGTLVLNPDLTYEVDVDAEATLFGVKGDYPINTVGTYVRTDNSVAFSLLLGETVYDVAGTNVQGVMTLTIADPASPIQTMVLVKRRG